MANLRQSFELLTNLRMNEQRMVVAKSMCDCNDGKHMVLDSSTKFQCLLYVVIIADSFNNGHQRVGLRNENSASTNI